MLDSSNLKYLDKINEKLPEVMEKRTRKKVAMGMKEGTAFGMKMSIHSLFDLRKTFDIFTDIFTGNSTLSQYYCSSFTGNMLKQFH